jgi:hypothetical protein
MGISGYIAVDGDGRTIRPRRKPHGDDRPRPGAGTSEADVRLFKRKPRDDEPVDMNARSPETGLKYKDLALLGQMLKAGADLTKPRHALYYLYFGSPDVASSGADEARAAGYDCAVGEPLPEYPGQWSLICQRNDVVLDIDGVRSADDLFQGIADRLQGEFDGWEAAV